MNFVKGKNDIAKNRKYFQKWSLLPANMNSFVTQHKEIIFCLIDTFMVANLSVISMNYLFNNYV